MRLALLPSQYLPSLGGVEELTRNLALNLARCGDEVEIWAPFSTEGPRVSAETIDGIRVRRFAYTLPRADPSSLRPFAREGYSTVRTMLRAAREFRPDVLNVQCFGPNGAYATAVSALTGIPLVISLQGETVMDDSDIYSVSATMRIALRVGILRARAVTGCSRFTLRDAEARFGLREGRGMVIFNDADRTLNSGGASFTIRPDLGAVLDRRYVLAVGRVVKKKGFDLLLDSFCQISADHLGTDLVIGGDGPKLDELRKRASDLGIAERVHFTGRLSREEVAVAMAGAYLFAMPSRLEPFGIVVLEAWRAGTAVVATSIGGPPEFVSHGVDGLLVDPHDKKALADALDTLLSDTSLRDKIASSGQKRFSDLASPRLANEFRKVYAGAARQPKDTRKEQLNTASGDG